MLLLLLLKSVELDDDVALLLSVAGLVMYSSANRANQTQEKINVGGGCVSLDPRTSLQTSEPGGMGRLPRQPVKVAAAGVCRSFRRREVRLTRDHNAVLAFVAAQTRHIT